MFMYTDKAGKRWPMIQSASRYRADGTLELTVQYAPELMPQEWTLYSADGKTPAVKVVNRVNGLPGVPFVEYVTFFHKDGPPVQYYANSHGIIWREVEMNADGTSTARSRYQARVPHEDFMALSAPALSSTDATAAARRF
jgi:hypothetical protein